jgi:hypothetical protein
LKPERRNISRFPLASIPYFTIGNFEKSFRKLEARK